MYYIHNIETPLKYSVSSMICQISYPILISSFDYPVFFVFEINNYLGIGFNWSIINGSNHYFIFLFD